MPTYEYRCNACSHEFETIHSITAGALRKCPSCGKLKLERLISRGGGIIFKGSGFYETDYRSKEYKEKAKAEKKAREPSAEKSSTGDAKSSAKKSNKAGPD